MDLKKSFPTGPLAEGQWPCTAPARAPERLFFIIQGPGKKFVISPWAEEGHVQGREKKMGFGSKRPKLELHQFLHV